MHSIRESEGISTKKVIFPLFILTTIPFTVNTVRVTNRVELPKFLYFHSLVREGTEVKFWSLLPMPISPRQYIYSSLGARHKNGYWM